MTLVLTPLTEIPLIQSGENLPAIILTCLETQGIILEDGDILSVTQKIVSKAEGRMVYLGDISPGLKAVEISRKTGKDARLVELILRESNEIIRISMNTIIVEHRLGFICANAGIDHSNIKSDYGSSDEWFLLLPENPEESAQKIREFISLQTNADIGVIVIDSHGRPWRLGTIGTMIGTSGVPALVDLRGTTDLFGYTLRITRVAAADELAAATSLIMGQADESIPVVHIRGFPYSLSDTSYKEVLRPKENDLFR